MPVINVNISPDILTWVLSQAQREKLGDKLMNNISEWINGTKAPTFNQIENLSKKSNIPLGYFFLQSPPEEILDLLEYRTIDSAELTNPSRNLIDTINNMEDVQDWMRNYREDLGYEPLVFVGSLKDNTDVMTSAQIMRNHIGLSCDWYEKCTDSRTAFNYIRGLLEKCGIIVMMNGIVGNNTHRALDIKEFRGFAMVDKWAPLIFINAADSQGGRLFSLLHEMTHIWLGEDDLYNLHYQRDGSVRSVEIICNAIAGEVLVPNQIFFEKWNKIAGIFSIADSISELATTFHCSEIVIARKALDNRMITQQTYDQISRKAADNYKETKSSRQQGGNYYRNMASRLDGCFVRALCESINMGRTSYTEAYRLTNTSRKTFSDVAQSLGGIEW
ncbi:MAG: ImmA/IrrE family metallo-endopeptidase [Lachnospiraceae bacterium]|nr:ImmA/IrrE family metallo-endopeptidase [Lachnospiraceae bacterium]